MRGTFDKSIRVEIILAPPIPIILFWTLRIAAQVQISTKMALEKSRSSNALRSQMHYWKNYRKENLKKKTRAGWSLNGLYSEKRARLRLNVHYVKTTSNHAAKLYYFLSFWFFHWMVWSIMINKIFCAYFSLGKRENNE